LRAEVTFFLTMVADVWASRIIQYAIWADDWLRSRTSLIGPISMVGAELLAALGAKR